MLKSVAVGGYKPFELGIFQPSHQGIPVIKETLRQKMIGMIEQGTEWFVSSGQSGVELWGLEVAEDLKKTAYPSLQTALLPPFIGWEEKWNEVEQEAFRKLFHEVDFCRYITDRPYESPAQLRVKNQFIVQHTSGMLLLYDEDHEGTPKYMLHAAKQQEQYPVVWVSPEDVAETERVLAEMAFDEWKVDEKN
ncbi:SLOG family protein [Aureibacillus halotolerans]|uniref:Putative phage-like protein YoqJ n=1 Tax=Aureibacillus halotolerans TaxID=1508390 RepID=A0A4V3D5V2_9BACI|nr:SLOG family protein [Aureibacillus halotolerans]TDQ41477.1 putative phage-like protein YoqJ [Aureibacillus halotolerans]